MRPYDGRSIGRRKKARVRKTSLDSIKKFAARGAGEPKLSRGGSGRGENRESGRCSYLTSIERKLGQDGRGRIHSEGKKKKKNNHKDRLK